MDFVWNIKGSPLKAHYLIPQNYFYQSPLKKSSQHTLHILPQEYIRLLKYCLFTPPLLAPNLKTGTIPHPDLSRKQLACDLQGDNQLHYQERCPNTKFRNHFVP